MHKANVSLFSSTAYLAEYLINAEEKNTCFDRAY